VNKTVYLLWFVQERDDAKDIELLIGVYETEADATAAIGRVKGKPGFVDFPEGFQVHAYQLGKDGWVDGFVRAS
jgi:homoserine kinase type II